MNRSFSQLGRYTRLALLLLMLAAQGIASAHELGDSHALESELCTTCVIGHGLGAAVDICPAAAQLPLYHAYVILPALIPAATTRTSTNFARAPPASL